MDQKPVISIDALYKSYFLGKQEIPVLKNINLNISHGDLIAITGTSGSGKSTLLNIIGILDYYDQGKYFLNNMLIKKFSERKASVYRNNYIGFVFQSFNLVTFKNALDNVSLPLIYQNVSRKERKMRASEMLNDLGMGDRLHHYPNELSGGQKQRVAIARALVTKPAIVLADEPTGALDSKTSSEIMELIQQINQNGATIIIVTHDTDVARLCKKQIHLRDGKIE